MRIAHINVERGYRGGERQTELLIRELEGRGQRQVLIARRGGHLASRLHDTETELRLVTGNPLSVALASGGVDLLHVHEGRSVYGAWLRSRVSGTPYIITRRVNNPLSQHWLAHRAYRGASSVVAVVNDVAEILRRFDSALEPHVIHSASSGLVADPATTQAIRETHAGKWLVGHVGALDIAQKAQDVILEVAGSLEATHPDIHFLLVGGGDDGERLRDAASHLDNVSFTGFVDNVGDYLAAFDVFILPSRREGIGGVLLDAMAQRLAVIASRVGGVPEIVHDGENGILIGADRPQELREAILRLRGSPEVARAMGERGAIIARDFSAAAMCERYTRLYEAALG